MANKVKAPLSYSTNARTTRARGLFAFLPIFLLGRKRNHNGIKGESQNHRVTGSIV